MGDLSFEYQDAVIAANYVEADSGNAIELTLSKVNAKIEDIEADLKKKGIEGSTGGGGIGLCGGSRLKRPRIRRKNAGRD